MDHNISGKTGPNRDHSDPEDKIRELSREVWTLRIPRLK